MKKQQILSALLLAGLILSSVGMAACSEGNEDTAKDGAVTTAAQTAEETLPRWKDSLPEGLDFEGTKITIHARGNEGTLRRPQRLFQEGSLRAL